MQGRQTSVRQYSCPCKLLRLDLPPSQAVHSVHPDDTDHGSMLTELQKIVSMGRILTMTKKKYKVETLDRNFRACRQDSVFSTDT